jgi:hypothetical protein
MSGAMSRVGDNKTPLAANCLYQALITQHGDRLTRRATGHAVHLLQVALRRHAATRRQFPAPDLLAQLVRYLDVDRRSGLGINHGTTTSHDDQLRSGRLGQGAPWTGIYKLASMMLMVAPTQHTDNPQVGQALVAHEPAHPDQSLVRLGEGHVNDLQPRSRRWHRGPKGADLLDLVFKITSKPGWTATLRNNPSVVLVAKDGDELARLTRELALAILQHRYPETLSAMRAVGSALPDPHSATTPADTCGSKAGGAAIL